MCLLCVEWEKGKLTNKEAMKALGELIANSDNEKTAHLMGLSNRILDKEFPAAKQDTELDAEWERRQRGSD